MDLNERMVIDIANSFNVLSLLDREKATRLVNFVRESGINGNRQTFHEIFNPFVWQRPEEFSYSYNDFRSNAELADFVESNEDFFVELANEVDEITKETGHSGASFSMLISSIYLLMCILTDEQIFSGIMTPEQAHDYWFNSDWEAAK
jgi:hypothetical protein